MRKCLLEPIPEIHLAAKLLDATVDAFLLGNKKLASQIIVSSDYDVIMKHAIRW
jgi:hypothetical protein